MAVLIPVAGPRLFWMIERWPKAGERQSGSGVTRRSDVQLGRTASGGGARPCQNAGPASVTLALVVVYFCVPVMLVGQLIQAHAPAMGSYQEKFGSAISSMATLVATLVLCFFLIPGMITQLRRYGM
uniref:Uncharacterized protein n=1 Tax=Setaria viridis TaxID=4556 RepID=A0A4U6U425_SETVI|nr:hypothetical protein SEVIR_6G152200v2 [Setaria viridis]